MNTFIKRQPAKTFDTLSVRLSIEQIEQVKQGAEKYNTTVSDIIRQALQISGILKEKETNNVQDNNP